MIGHDGEDNMEVKNRKLSSITAYGKNAKKHDKTQINNVAESIKQYGFVQPIVIDRDGVIVIGHCRALAAKKLGMEEVPCVCVDDLTPEQVNALRLVDNKSNESDWDFDLRRLTLTGACATSWIHPLWRTTMTRFFLQSRRANLAMCTSSETIALCAETARL